MKILIQRTTGVVLMLLAGSTIAPPKTLAIFLTDISWLLDTRKDNKLIKYIYICISIHFLVCKGLTINLTRTFRHTTGGAGFETGDFVKEYSWGGYRRTTLIRVCLF